MDVGAKEGRLRQWRERLETSGEERDWESRLYHSGGQGRPTEKPPKLTGS